MRKFVFHTLAAAILTTAAAAQNPWTIESQFRDAVLSSNYAEAATHWNTIHSYSPDAMRLLLELTTTYDHKFRDYLLKLQFPNFASFTSDKMDDSAPTFGPELTFTNAEIFKADQKENEEYYKGINVPFAQGDQTFHFLKLWAQSVSDLCDQKNKDGLPHCVVVRTQVNKYVEKNLHVSQWMYKSIFKYHSYEIYFPDGFMIRGEMDHCALEFQTTPLTLKQAENVASLITKFIYEPCAKLNLFPHHFIGGGHIHIGVQNLSPFLVRNFIVDFFNHSHFWAQITKQEFHNAKTLGHMGIKAYQALTHLLFQYDQKQKDDNDWNSLFSLLEDIDRNVYCFSGKKTSYGILLEQPALKFKYLTRSVDASRRTLEVRAFPAQRSWEEFCAGAALLQARLEHLQRQENLVQLRPFKEIDVGSIAERVKIFSGESRTMEVYHREKKSRAEWLRYLSDLEIDDQYQRMFAIK